MEPPARELSREWREAIQHFKSWMTGVRGAWPTALVSLLVVGALLLPNLASEQAREVLLNLDHGPWREGFAWSGVLSILAAAFVLCACLRYWTARLLHCEREEVLTLKPVSAHARVVVHLVWTAPCVALALIFAGVHHTSVAEFFPRLTPYGLAALLAIVLPVLMFLIGLGVEAVGLNALYARTRWMRIALHAILPVLFLACVVVFGSPGRDRAWGLPVDPVGMARALGPIALLMLGVACVTAPMAWAVVTSRRTRAPVALGLMLLPLVLSAADVNDNHFIRTVEGGRGPARPVSLSEALERWADAHPAGSAGASPILLVSTEGGGVRAAYFTAVALGRIADKCPSAAGDLFAISGVSGGALGASVYAAAVKSEADAGRPLDVDDPRCDFTDPGAGRFEHAVGEVFRRDHLSPILSRMFFPDLAQRFLPFPVPPFDRQLGLEFSLRRSFEAQFGADTLGRDFFELQPAPQTPAVPWMFLNTTIVSSGEPSVASTLDYGASALNRGPYTVISLAGTSARFPVVSPSGHIPLGASNPLSRSYGLTKLRYVDGGYYDNSGVETLHDLYAKLVQLRASPTPPRALKGAPIFWIHIGSQPACGVQTRSRACSAAARRMDGKRSEGLDEVYSPVRAVLSVRRARIEAASSAMAVAVGDARRDGDRAYTLEMTDRGVDVPLGWYLADSSADELSDEFRRHADDTAQLRTAGGFAAEDDCVNVGCELDRLARDIRTPAARLDRWGTLTDALAHDAWNDRRWPELCGWNFARCRQAWETSARPSRPDRAPGPTLRRTRAPVKATPHPSAG